MCWISRFERMGFSPWIRAFLSLHKLWIVAWNTYWIRNRGIWGVFVSVLYLAIRSPCVSAAQISAETWQQKNIWSRVSNYSLHMTQIPFTHTFHVIMRSHVERRLWIANHVTNANFGVEWGNQTPLCQPTSRHGSLSCFHVCFALKICLNLSPLYLQ